MVERNNNLLEIVDLELSLQTRFGIHRPIVENASLTLEHGHVHAVVGESGSGKTMLARSIVGLLPNAVRQSGGQIRYNGQRLDRLEAQDFRKIRGREIGFVFQEPMLSLNPAITVGDQMREGLRLHTSMQPTEIDDYCLLLLDRVGIRNPTGAFRAYPSEYSGGMRQRIMLASVLALKPKLLIADEPTTALDAIIQREVLDLMVEMTQEAGTSVLLITHDLGLVGEYAKDVTVMKRGKVVEVGSSKTVFCRPAQDYTRMLLSASPKRDKWKVTSSPPSPLLTVKNAAVVYRGKRKWPWSRRVDFQAVHGISLELGRGENLGIVGESGSGKTTLGRAITGLQEMSGGEIHVEGQKVDLSNHQEWRAMRSKMQVVFQDPASSLNPRFRIGELVGEGLRHAQGLDKAEKSRRVVQCMRDVGLDEQHITKFPHELSGGQKQRVAIARAIIMRPDIIMADEPVSALDLTVQAQVLAVLMDLQEKFGFSYLFVSHDLAVVEQVASRVMVMRLGRVIEAGPRNEIYDRPLHPYTRRLLSASTVVSANGNGGFDVHARQVADRDSHLECLPFYEDGPNHRLHEAVPGHFVALNQD